MTSVGGYPGDEQKGVALFRTVDGKKMTEDFVAAAVWIKKRPDSTRKLGAVGFCFGGGMVNQLAVRLGKDLNAGVAFYGSQAGIADVPKIFASLMFHYAGDVQLSLAQLVPVQGAVLVTTPQEVSLSDVRRAVKMFEQVNVPVLGVFENMSYFVSPVTGNTYEIFGKGGGQNLCDEYGLNFLSQVPIGMEVRGGGDTGIPVVVSYPDSPQSKAFDHAAEDVARHVSIEAMKAGVCDNVASETAVTENVFRSQPSNRYVYSFDCDFET